MSSSDSWEEESELVIEILHDDLKSALEEKDLRHVNYLLQARKRTEYTEGSPILHEIVATKKEELVKLMLQVDDKDINTINYDGEAPLHIAARSGNVAIAKMLLDKGAEINTLTEYCYKTSLHVAGCGGHKQMINFLIDNGSEIDVQDRSGTTMLHWASHWNNVELVNLLISKGVRVNYEIDFGQTALHIAANMASADVIGPLIKNGSKTDWMVFRNFLSRYDKFKNESYFNLIIKTGAGPIPPDYRIVPSSPMTDKLAAYIKTVQSNVQPLFDLSRITVRNLLIAKCEGRYFTKAVEKLCLPIAIEKIIFFDREIAFLSDDPMSLD